ncbi:hypothetical protein M422DRAFT_774963 [Sphaerobolus stellatus SS14]|nr:hypothetical protein M422DRAFT_774963 [Sphaerobolus stellatus SS14]
MASASPSCRILTVSSSPTQAKLIVQRIIAAQPIPEQTTLPPTQPGSSSSVEYFPWMISNKYYSAPVHFFITQIAELTNGHTTEVPACLYVFDPAKTFKDEFTSLTNHFEGSDFEVSIAVSVPSTTQPPTTEEHEALEAFFGEFGFEYVNGDTTLDTTQGHDLDDLEGIPGINRIVDALSTILWPSMVQKSGSRRAKARSVVSVPGPPGDDEENEGLRALLNSDGPRTTSANEPTSLQREKAALQKWLEEDVDAWQPEAPAASTSSAAGFDDNFSDFISAPSQLNEEEQDGDEDDEFVMPSHAEIEAMSQRIRGMGQTDDADDFGNFDLSSVLAGLEAMKAEIAGITDEDQKRKAAAQVALGLVYGLEGEELE